MQQSNQTTVSSSEHIWCMVCSWFSVGQTRSLRIYNWVQHSCNTLLKTGCPVIPCRHKSTCLQRQRPWMRHAIHPFTARAIPPEVMRHWVHQRPQILLMCYIQLGNCSANKTLTTTFSFTGSSEVSQRDWTNSVADCCEIGQFILFSPEFLHFPHASAVLFWTPWTSMKVFLLLFTALVFFWFRDPGSVSPRASAG